jgi:hypothetical protein
MSYDDEVLVHPRPETLLSLPVPELQAELVRILDREVGAERADFDVLFGAGQIAFRRRVPGVEIAVQEWLRRRADDRRFDVAACFLMGYWRGRETVSPTLVDDLLPGLDRPMGVPGGADAIVQALAVAFPCLEPAPAARVRQRLAEFSERGPHQPATEAALRFVLDAGG